MGVSTKELTYLAVACSVDFRCGDRSNSWALTPNGLRLHRLANHQGLGLLFCVGPERLPWILQGTQMITCCMDKVAMDRSGCVMFDTGPVKLNSGHNLVPEPIKDWCSALGIITFHQINPDKLNTV